MSQSVRRVAIVTGAARGIGAAIARQLAADGMAVAVVDLDEKSGAETVDAIVAAGGSAIAIGADVAEKDQVQAAVERTAAELGAAFGRDRIVHAAVGGGKLCRRLLVDLEKLAGLRADAALGPVPGRSAAADDGLRPESSAQQ